MKIKQIWIIYDDDSEAITAQTWSAAVRAWAYNWNITADSHAEWDETSQRYITLREKYGEDWLETLIALGPKVFGDMYDEEYFADQISYYKE